MRKEIFLKALEEGWKAHLKNSKKLPEKDRLVKAAMETLKALGDTLISREDVEKVAGKVLKE